MATIPYTKQQFCERIQIHAANNWPGSDSRLTTNQVLLYVDQALAVSMVGQVYGLAKIEGNLCMPEAYITTYSFDSLQQDAATGYWYVTLPQTPVSLPLGYSITDAFFAKTAYGQADPILPIKNKRVAYRRFMPLPTGTRYWVEGDRMWLQASNNQPLLNQTLYVKMAKSRTDSLTETMSLPDDVLENIWNNVIAKCKDRLGIPQDQILDGLPAGNKAS